MSLINLLQPSVHEDCSEKFLLDCITFSHTDIKNFSQNFISLIFSLIHSFLRNEFKFSTLFELSEMFYTHIEEVCSKKRHYEGFTVNFSHLFLCGNL